MKDSGIDKLLYLVVMAEAKKHWEETGKRKTELVVTLNRDASMKCEVGGCSGMFPFLLAELVKNSCECSDISIEEMCSIIEMVAKLSKEYRSPSEQHYEVAVDENLDPIDKLKIKFKEGEME